MVVGLDGVVGDFLFDTAVGVAVVVDFADMAVSRLLEVEVVEADGGGLLSVVLAVLLRDPSSGAVEAWTVADGSLRGRREGGGVVGDLRVQVLVDQQPDAIREVVGDGVGELAVAAGVVEGGVGLAAGQLDVMLDWAVQAVVGADELAVEEVEGRGAVGRLAEGVLAARVVGVVGEDPPAAGQVSVGVPA